MIRVSIEGHIGNLENRKNGVLRKSGETTYAVVPMAVNMAGMNLVDAGGNPAQTVTRWFRLKIFGPAAERAVRWLKSGMPVVVDGRLTTDRIVFETVGTDGQTSYSSRLYDTVIVDRILPVDVQSIVGRKEEVPAAKPVEAHRPVVEPATPQEEREAFAAVCAADTQADAEAEEDTIPF